MKLEVGMYVRGKYYSYRGKIGEIVKCYNGDLEIAYKDSLVKTTVSSFIDDNFDINGKQYVASHDITDLIEVGDYVNGCFVLEKDSKFIVVNGLDNYGFGQGVIPIEDIKTIVTKEQFKSMSYKVGE